MATLGLSGLRPPLDSLGTQLDSVQLAAAVQALLDSPPCRGISEVRGEWAALALSAACESPSPETALRSAQLLCALRPPLAQASAASLCECLAACLSPQRAARAPAHAQRFALQALHCLHAGLSRRPQHKRLLHPTLFWAAYAALQSSQPRLAGEGARLLLLLLPCCERFDAQQGWAVEVLLLAAPSAAGLAEGMDPFGGLCAPTLRCACQPAEDQAAAAAQLLCALAALPPSGAADALFGERQMRLSVGLGVGLAYLAAAPEAAADGASASCGRLLAAALRGSGQPGARRLARRLLQGGASLVEQAALLARSLSAAQASLAAQALLALLRGGPPSWAPACLTLLGACLGPPCAARPVPELAPLTAAALGPHASMAREALALALRAEEAQRGIEGGGGAQAALWTEADAAEGAALLAEALASGAVGKRRDGPAFLHGRDIWRQ